MQTSLCKKVHIKENNIKQKAVQTSRKRILKELELDTTVNVTDIRKRTGPHLDVGLRNEEGSSMYRKAENFGSATVASNTCNTVFRLRAATWVCTNGYVVKKLSLKINLCIFPSYKKTGGDYVKELEMYLNPELARSVFDGTHRQHGHSALGSGRHCQYFSIH